MSRLRTDGGIVFEIDEHPLSLRLPSIPDYIGRQLCNALYEPLLHTASLTGELLPGAASSWEVSADGLDWEFTLPGRIKWSDRKPVTAEDALAGIVAAAGHPTWGRHLAVLMSGRAEGDTTLRLRLRRPAAYLGHLLAAVDVAPRHPAVGSDPQYSGPFRLSGRKANSYHLLPNEGFPEAGVLPPLTFRVNRVPERSIEGYATGQYDVTCHTGFPFSRLADCRGRPEFHSSGAGITMQLELPPLGGGRCREAAARAALFLALDRDAIAAELAGGIVPLATFGPSCCVSPSLPLPTTPDVEAARACLKGQRELARGVRVFFHDYYPNRQVLAAVCAQWEATLGITSVCTPIGFSEACPDGCDLLLALRFPTYPHAWAQLDYYSELLRVFEPASAEEYRGLVREWAECAHVDGIDSVPITAILVRAIPFIPLFEVHGHWLQRREVTGFRYPPHACFDFRGIRWRE